jgi:tRNA (adenine-N(1)-)-methyltransferase non-catalytic subunit
MRECGRYMRVDTLAQILTIANVHSGCNVMLVESCQGLVTGAVLERLGGVHVHITKLIIYNN